jgi:hypothetical protein
MNFSTFLEWMVQLIKRSKSETSEIVPDLSRTRKSKVVFHIDENGVSQDLKYLGRPAHPISRSGAVFVYECRQFNESIWTGESQRGLVAPTHRRADFPF